MNKLDNTIELRVDLMQTFLDSELIIPALIKFQQMLLPFKDEHPDKAMYHEIGCLVTQLRNSRSRIDLMLQSARLPRTGQVWWPGSEEKFYLLSLERYVRRIIILISEGKIDFDFDRFTSEIILASDKDWFLKQGYIPPKETTTIKNDWVVPVTRKPK
ncbi:MAG: hypothetical protein JWM20_415 [Patescibacteria group bacterium]|nr:hypothetical protein [Patescibacteria group bacterium]